MNRPKKLRLLFDLAGLLGLVILGLSLWFGHPHPKWRVPLGPTYTFALGFSADNQKVYSIKDTITQRHQIPQPILQRWEASTGILEAEYPLQVPPENVAQIKANPKIAQSFAYSIHLNRDKLLCEETPARTLFYDVENGRCLSQKPFNAYLSWYYWHNFADQHSWGISVSEDPNDKDKAKANLYDLNNGEIILTFKNSSDFVLQDCRLSADEQYLLMLWRNDSQVKGLGLQPNQLEIIQIGNWKSLFRLPLVGACAVGHLLKPNLLVQTSYIKANKKDYYTKRLECFRFDPENGTLKPDENHPFHGFVCRELIEVQNDLLLRHGIRGSSQSMMLPW